MSRSQLHEHFKIFTGPLAADGTLGGVADAVAAFAKKEGVAAKSIGVEYLEESKKVVFSLGYTKDEAGYPIKIVSKKLGKMGTLEGADASRLEASMAGAAQEVARVLCHELYITGTGELVMIFLARAE